MLLRATGIDAAFANMGFVQVIIDTAKLSGPKHLAIAIESMHLVSTAAEDKKQVRKSSDDLRRAMELHDNLILQCAGKRFAFAEVPSGSQSANAARALGIAVGVLASCPILLLEVSPMEVKVAVSGSRKTKVTKAQVIKWAVQHWPLAPWLRESRGKEAGRILNSNEHLADAMATVVAGLDTPAFLNLIAYHDAVTSKSPTLRIKLS